MQAKINQHFVSQFYLRNWSKDKTKVNVAFAGNKKHLKSIDDIGLEKYMYKINGITENTKALLTKTANKLPPIVTKDAFISIINHCYLLGCLCEAAGDNKTEEIEAHKTNIIEDFYGITEAGVSDAVKEITTGMPLAFGSQQYDDLIRFMTFQLVRTQKARANVRARIEDILTDNGIEFDDYHAISALILAEELHLAIMEKLYKITIIENISSINFITNDNPVVNLLNPEGPHIKLYWPVSPRKAILLSPSTMSDQQKTEVKENFMKTKVIDSMHLFESCLYSEAEVRLMNDKIWSAKYRYAFFLDEADVATYAQ